MTLIVDLTDIDKLIAEVKEVIAQAKNELSQAEKAVKEGRDVLKSLERTKALLSGESVAKREYSQRFDVMGTTRELFRKSPMHGQWAVDGIIHKLNEAGWKPKANMSKKQAQIKDILTKLEKEGVITTTESGHWRAVQP